MDERWRFGVRDVNQRERWFNRTHIQRRSCHHKWHHHDDWYAGSREWGYWCHDLNWYWLYSAFDQPNLHWNGGDCESVYDWNSGAGWGLLSVDLERRVWHLRSSLDLCGFRRHANMDHDHWDRYRHVDRREWRNYWADNVWGSGHW
jgi:hypothetical protein